MLIMVCSFKRPDSRPRALLIVFSVLEQVTATCCWTARFRSWYITLLAQCRARYVHPGQSHTSVQHSAQMHFWLLRDRKASYSVSGRL